MEVRRGRFRPCIKHGVLGLTKTAALDGRGQDIALGQIDIGHAVTDTTECMKRGVPQANGTMMPESTIDPQHFSDAVLYMAGLPLDANVLSMTVMVTNCPMRAAADDDGADSSIGGSGASEGL